MEEDLTAWLLADPAVAGPTARRVNWHERPQSEGLPAVTLTVVSAFPAYTSDGQQSDLRKWVVQADCWGATAQQALDLRRAVEARVEAINLNPLAAQLEGGFSQQIIAGETDSIGGGGRIFRQILDFAVWRRG